MRSVLVSTFLAALAALTAGLLLLGGCSEDTTSPKPIHPDWIRGQVRDADGAPVPDAAIMMTYNVSLPKPSTDISFDLPVNAHVEAWIEDPCRGERVRSLLDEESPAGLNFTIYDGEDDEGRSVLEGVYDFVVHADTIGIPVFADTIRFFYQRGPYPSEASPDTFRHLTTANSQGFFEFSQSCLHLGEWIHLGSISASEDSLFVPRYVRIWAVADGYATDWTGLTEIGENSGANVSLQLAPLTP